MSSNTVLFSALFGLGAFGLGWVLYRAFIRFARKLGAISVGSLNTEERWSTRTRPVVGGLVFFIVFLVCSVAALALQMAWPGSVSQEQLLQLGGMWLAATVAFVFGLVDDAYNTRASLKLAGQVACGIIIVASGSTIVWSGMPLLDGALTLLWVVGLMNSFNMLDNMDGVSGSFAVTVLAAGLLLVGLMGGAGVPDTMLIAGMVGCLVAFLLLNWHPSRLFMGDTGSQFLGLFLAYVGIHLFWNRSWPDGYPSMARGLILPVTAFFMTILDTTFVTIARLARGQSPFVGGKDHISHHLVYYGVAEKRVGLIFLLSSAGLNLLVLGYALTGSPWHWGWTALFTLVLATVTGVTATLYRQAAQKKRAALAAQMAPEEVVPAVLVAPSRVLAPAQPEPIIHRPQPELV